MRTIDDDPALLAAARRFHEGELTEKQMHWTLGDRGYSKEEIESALNDFRWIHVEAPLKVRNFLLPACLVCLAFLALLFFLS